MISTGDVKGINVSELHAKVPVHVQCYRMAPNGTGLQQLTHDERVNWFPHASPDGNWIVYRP